MIFVCGCPHSGTSLVAAMLGAHPEIYTIPIETAAFTRNDFDEIRIRAFFQRYEEEAGDVRYLCEKTPGHTGQLAEIYRVFPKAKVVAIMRDPRAVAASMRGRFGSLDPGSRRWNAAGRRIRKLLAGDHAAHLVAYEDLIAHPEDVLSKLCAFLDLGFDPAMLEFHRDERDWFKARGRRDNQGQGQNDQRAYRNWQIHQPLMDKRFQWRELLTPDEVARVETECAALMAHFGYQPEAAPA